MTSRRRQPRGRGGKNGHEPRPRIWTREARALELSVQGRTQHQIGEELGITQPAVSKILRRLEERHLREQSATLDRLKARQTLRLEHQYAQAMGAWEESKQDSTVRRQRRGQGRSDSDAHAVAELIVENQHGDPRFLEQARKALSDLRKVWGIDAPQQVAVTPARPTYDHMSPEDLHREIERQQKLLGSALSPATGRARGGA